MQSIRTPILLTLLASLSLMMQSAAADLVVLQYHHIADDTPGSTSTSPALFRQQLDMITQLQLEVVPLRQGTKAALAGRDPATNTIAITFDDAYESVHSYAAPLLEQQQMPYTVFVNPEAIGSPGYMTWEQLRMMTGSRLATIANHSNGHGHLARKPGETKQAWHQRTDRSLDLAQKFLQQKLGVAEPMFAYPYGEFDQALEDKVRQRGWYGFGQQSGAIGRYSASTRLPRFPMANTYGQLGSLKDKLLSKAFPTDAGKLPDGIVEQNPPVLVFAYGPEINTDRLSCFASGLGRIRATVNGDEVSVQAPKAINSRRFRYNCTHPAGDGSYYWLSQQWLNLQAPED